MGINPRSEISKGEIFQGAALKLFALSCSIWEMNNKIILKIHVWTC
jgi:hypothetical protein